MDVGIKSPFHERLQYYMDWSFTTGLTKYWNFLNSLELSIHQEVQNAQDTDENVYLTLYEIRPIFVGLFIGFSLSSMAFLLEILHHKYPFLWDKILSWQKNFFKLPANPFKRSKGDKLKVQMIQVRPINPV